MKTNSSVSPTNSASAETARALPETLQAHLRTLGLTYMEEHAASAAQQAAREGHAHLSYLETLATGEAARAHDRCVARRLAAARFPVSKTMAGWNWSWPKKINRMQFEHLLQLGFLQEHANVVLLGPTGVGKTHLACALGHAACRAGYDVLFLRADRLFQLLLQARADHSTDKALRRLLTPDVLIVDDFGLRRLDARQSSDFYEVVLERHRRASTLLSSNRTIDEWIPLFDDPILAQSAIDRLAHNAYQVVIEGESYRKRQRPGEPRAQIPRPRSPLLRRRRTA